MNFQLDDTEYRITRVDFRNLAIQRRRGHYSPDASDNLVQQLERLEEHFTACSEAILAALSTR